MDLSQIEAWTRMALEVEAQRRGIRDPEFRSRAELVRLILRDEYGEAWARGRRRMASGLKSLQHARGLAAVAANVVASSLPGPLDTFLGLRSRLSLSRHGSRPESERRDRSAPVDGPGARSAPTAVATPARPSAAGPATEQGTRPSVWPAEAAATPAEQAATATAPEAPAAVEHEDGPSAVASAAGPTPATRSFTEEPIGTHSMARLLARQGHRERALAIYEELLARCSDETLQREADQLRGGGPSGATAPADALPVPQARPRPASDDRVDCEALSAGGLRVRWSVTDPGLARARDVLGAPGELAVRVVAIVPDADRVVRSDITEHGPVPAAGQWCTGSVPSDARCLVAVGLREPAGGRFVSIAHRRFEVV